MKATIGKYNAYYSGCAARLTDGTLIWMETTDNEHFYLPDLTPHSREQQINLLTPRWPEDAEL